MSEKFEELAKVNKRCYQKLPDRKTAREFALVTKESTLDKKDEPHPFEFLCVLSDESTLD